MGVTRADAPLEFAFKSVSRMHNGGIVYNLDSMESAKWLRSPDVMKSFLEHFGDQASCMKVHTYSTLAEFIPVACKPDNSSYLRITEGTNNLDPNVIEEAHWIKPPECRVKGQKVAHLILRFNDPWAANRAICNGHSQQTSHGKETDLGTTPMPEMPEDRSSSPCQ
ncbi:hypothetical protein BKA93DRAFT_737571 [Sparassis latifolia]